MLDVDRIIGPADQRACTGLSHPMVPPERPPGGNMWDAGPGKALCSSCPSLARCRAYALTDLAWAIDKWNILGGYTAHERREIRRGNRPASDAPPIDLADGMTELCRPGPTVLCRCGSCATCRRRRSRYKAKGRST